MLTTRKCGLLSIIITTLGCLGVVVASHLQKRKIPPIGEKYHSDECFATIRGTLHHSSSGLYATAQPSTYLVPLTLVVVGFIIITSLVLGL
jgi:hypothetical protein